MTFRPDAGVSVPMSQGYLRDNQVLSPNANNSKESICGCFHKHLGRDIGS